MPNSNRRKTRRHIRKRKHHSSRTFRMKGGEHVSIELKVCLQNVDASWENDFVSTEVVSANQDNIIQKLNLFFQKVIESSPDDIPEHVSNVLISSMGESKFRIDYDISDSLDPEDRAHILLMMESFSLYRNFMEVMGNDAIIMINGARHFIHIIFGADAIAAGCDSVYRMRNYDAILSANNTNAVNGNHNIFNYNAEPLPGLNIDLPSLRQAIVLSTVENNFEYDTIPIVHDIINLEDIPLTEVDMADSIIFKHGSSFFVHSKATIREQIDNRDQIAFECNAEHMPIRTNINEGLPYFKLWGPGPIFLVKLGELLTALDHPVHNVFELMDDTLLPFTTSYNAVIVDNATGRGYHGNVVNHVSEDHCQAGTEKRAYTIHILNMIHIGSQAGGRRTLRGRRAVARKARKTRRI